MLQRRYGWESSTGACLCSKFLTFKPRHLPIYVSTIKHRTQAALTASGAQRATEVQQMPVLCLVNKSGASHAVSCSIGSPWAVLAEDTPSEYSLCWLRQHGVQINCQDTHSVRTMSLSLINTKLLSTCCNVVSLEDCSVTLSNHCM